MEDKRFDNIIKELDVTDVYSTPSGRIHIIFKYIYLDRQHFGP